MKLARQWVLLSLVAITTQSLNAADGKHELIVNLGAGIPTSGNDFNDSAKTGVAGMVEYLHRVSDRIKVGGRFAGFSFPAEDRQIAVSGSPRLDAESESDAATVELIGRYGFRENRKVRPYLMGGVGANRFAQETEAKPVSGSLWTNTATSETRMIADDSSTGYALSIGGGVAMDLGPRTRIGLQALWHTLGVDNDEFGSDAINFPSISFNFGWSFGG